VPLLAAQSRHEKPYPQMSKINFRLAFSEARRIKYIPFPRPAQERFWEIEVSGRIRKACKHHETDVKLVGRRVPTPPLSRANGSRIVMLPVTYLP